ncbi:unnamed protein product, partial [Symbiodinium sp. KB8]
MPHASFCYYQGHCLLLWLQWSAIFSALFHFVATVLIVIVIAFPADREGDCTPEKVRAFDEKCLRDEWNHMGDYRYLEFSYDLFGALGAFLLVPAVLVITDYFSRFSSSTRIMVSNFDLIAPSLIPALIAPL